MLNTSVGNGGLVRNENGSGAHNVSCPDLLTGIIVLRFKV